MTALARPKGLQGILRTFGDPKPYLHSDGTIDSAWEAILGTIALPAPIALSWAPATRVHRIRCNRQLVPVLGLVFRDIHADGLWPELKEFGGCYAWRVQRGSHEHLSTHCWGISLDLNPSTNKQGEVGDMHPGIVERFERHGFLWGGRFTTTIDWMHFQFAEGY